ncbi:MAG TPA: N,N-dimethylformamidase beta subunit family domain-containing protein, partial [Gaiellaceae bacterium]
NLPLGAAPLYKHCEGTVRKVYVTAAILGLFAGLPAAAPAAPVSAIVAENSLPGSTDWVRQQGGDIQIYGTQISAAPGGEIDLHVSTAYRYRVIAYRLGWYGGDGAREVACVPSCGGDEAGALQPQPQPPFPAASEAPIRANWPVTDVLSTGPDWTSGYYLVEAILTNGPMAGRVATTFFVLHETAESSPSQIVVQVPVNTWEAYNSWGGRSLYSFTGPRMYRVSFERPFGFLAQSPFWWEIDLVRFLEREGYDVSYQTDLDTHADPGSLLRHRLVIDAGHDEYWTAAMRDAFATALGDGTNLAFMGSNDAYWHAEYEDGGQTIFAYKSLYDPNPILQQKTALWREIGHPECELTGTENQSVSSLTHPLDYTVTAAGAEDPWLRGTGLAAGSVIAGIVGREHDVLNPFPQSCVHPGLVDLFRYAGAPGDQNGDGVRFTAPSGARIFASGAQAFSLALDDWRSDGTIAPQTPVVADRVVPVDPRVQQFMRNALDDLTRPASPQQLVVTQSGRWLKVEFAPDPDARIRTVVVGVRRGDTWLPLCHGLTGCIGSAHGMAGQQQVGAVAVDQWNRNSSAAYGTVTVREVSGRSTRGRGGRAFP